MRISQTSQIGLETIRFSFCFMSYGISLLIIIMTEPIKEIVQKELNQTPVHEFAESQPVKSHENNEVSSNNQPAAKHKRKKRRHKKIKHHKDPQEIKQIKLERIYIKRQELWNNRFVNDTIPDLYNKSKKKKSEIRRNKSPLETVYMDKNVTKETKVPNLAIKQQNRESIEKYTQKSFNIRTVTTKKEHSKKTKKVIPKSQERQDKIKPNLTIQREEKLQKDQNRDKALTVGVKLGEPQKPVEKSKLLAKLEQKTKIHPISQEYKSLLLDLITLQSTKKSKQLRTMLDHQIASIGQEKNVYTRIEGMIKQRKSLLKSIDETNQNTTLRTLMSLQIISVGLIEEILKFKAKWEEQYFKLQKPKKVSYFYQGQNYLLLMKNQAHFVKQENDPFLISRTAKLQNLVGGGLREEQLQQKKQMMLKIRACELLLIQEELTEQKP